MTTIAQKEHGVFMKVRNTKWFRHKVKQSHDFYVEELIKQIIIMEFLPNKDSHDQKAVYFLNEIISKFANDYYLSVHVDTIVLTSRQFRSVCTLGFCYANTIAEPFIDGHPKSVLEIRNIYSARKGEGYKLITRLLELAEHLGVPVTLWTETDHNTKYFERYGFKTMGKLGENGESLMIFTPHG